MQEKQRLRESITARREELQPETAAKWSAGITERLLTLPEFNASESVFCYVSMPGEPETREIISASLKSGKRIYVPRSHKDGQMDVVRITSLDQLSPGRFNIPEPPPGFPPSDPQEIDICIIPALACSTDRQRLGRGGGYYDRFIARSEALCAALCFEEFIFAGLPSEAFDMRPDIVISEIRTIR